MLQPLQLEDVFHRHAEEIAELRHFLSKAGLAVETSHTLHAVVLRLQSDKAFHRDLTSHLWVLFHRRGEEISFATLLGILAVAGAGREFAAAADARDAHDLLRFLMEARNSFGAPAADHGPAIGFETAPSTAPATALVNAQSTVPGERPQPVAGNWAPRQAPRPSSGGRRRAAWLAVAACLLLGLLAAVRLYSHRASASQSSADATSPATPTVASTAPTTAASDREAEAASLPSSAEAPPATAVLPRRTVPERAVGAAPGLASPSLPAAAEIQRVPPQQFASMPSGAGLGASAPAPVSRPIHATAGSAAPVPTAVLSKRLGARSLPADAWPDTAEHSRYPRLLRRRPASAVAPQTDENSTLLAETAPESVPSPLASTHNVVRTGVVRPVSLGIMAGNVLYSPVPAYPAAASAAGVEGTVKVEAEVDRDGNVASARVISGPPLLRDAAMDAVQRWRYRPWLAAGKPAPASAIAVVEFQLP